MELCAQYDALAVTKAFLDREIGSLSGWLGGVNPRQVVFLGCGSSLSVSKSLADSAYMHLRLNARALAAGDVLLHAKRYAGALRGALLITISRSGSTSEIIRALEALRDNGCPFKHLSISCMENSPLDKMSDRFIDMPWTFDESVCQTRTVSCLYFTGLYLISHVAGDVSMRRSLVDIIDNGAAFLERIEEQCKSVALDRWDKVVTLGDAEIAGLCEEGALAFNEICQIPSNFYHLLDARHGPMVLIAPQTLVIAAISDAENALERDMLKDLKARGAAVIAISAAPVEMDGIFNISWGGALNHAALGLVFILICQLISYYKSLQTGANPDKPDGLAPWIIL